MAKQSFLHFLTIRTPGMLGRITWPFAIIINGALLAFTITGPIPVQIISGIFLIGFWIGMWHNWTVWLRLEDHDPDNHIYHDVCEGCNPVRMADGSAVYCVVRYLAAVRKVSREKAFMIMMDADQEGQQEIYRWHQSYLRSVGADDHN